uniref:helix-turn-helix transcriptional regulator n=1 Tax=Fulvivirga sp. TaxID=1931237 RepID=UPI00404AC4CB
MNRIDRLSAILIQLQSKKVVRALEIAERFDISLRTVYRDIRALEEAGVPIGAEAGVGYFMMEGYSLPPVKFSKDEAGAILMATKLAEKQTDVSIRNNLNDALFKIRSALKVEEKDYLESIENNIEVIHSPQTINADFPNNFLANIQSALANKKVINFDYYSNYNDAFTNRDVEPMSLCYYARNWHLVGYCRLRNDLRDFRSDRIMKLRTTETSFDPARHEDYKGYLDTIVRGTDLIEVNIRFDVKVSRYIQESRYFMGFIESEVNDNYVDMKFMTSNLNIFARWLLQFTTAAKVISPSLLEDKVIEFFQEGLAAYSQVEAK